MKYSMRYMMANLAKQLGVKFDPKQCQAVLEMRKEITSLPEGGIQFTITRESNGDWVAESVSIPGILTGGTANDDINEMVKDAIFTYYGIPPEYCDNRILRESGEPVTVKHAVFATA